MKIHFMKYDALEYFKGNIDNNLQNYLEDNNEWLYEKYKNYKPNEEVFGEFKFEVENLEAVIIPVPEETPRQTQNLDTVLDLTIVTDTKSRLFIPAKSNPIVRGLAVQTEPLRLQIDSRYGTSSFTGAFSMKGGEILYLNRTFYVREASAVLNETIDSFDPVLNAKAEIRERDTSGDPVRIMLTVAEQPMSRLDPDFSSIPSKNRQEIMTLLGKLFFAGISKISYFNEELPQFITKIFPVLTSDIIPPKI